jgi:hypothetical protein
MDADFIRTLFADPQMLRMGHAQRAEDLNLGLGWLYYALARIVRPQRAVVIGSYRGFVPLVIAKAMQDNVEGGELWFVDPSLVDGFWRDPAQVDAHFRGHGVTNVRHRCMTTQAFVDSAEYAALDAVGLLMIDGMHTAEQARYDYLAFVDRLTPDAVTIFHDSTHEKTSPIYGPGCEYTHTVFRFIERLRATPGVDVFDLPVDSGVTLVRGRPLSREAIDAPFA